MAYDGQESVSGDLSARAATDGPWFRYANLKVEAAIFLAILVTFAAVLGKSAITSQTLTLSEQSGRFAGYLFSDAESGGRSVAAADPDRPLAWTCAIRQGASYPYCGYGMELAGGRGLDLSRIRTVTLRFTYRGDGQRLKLSAKTALSPEARRRAGPEGLPSAVEFPVVNGENVVQLPMDRLAPEQWFIARHGLSAKEAVADWRRTTSVAISTSDAGAPSSLAVTLHDVTFEGSYLSTEQWYLVILGVWLVLTGAFLLHRFFHMRGAYEARQRGQQAEAAALAQARAAAETASQAKSRFLGTMSHELRTPLNAVLGYAYWLGRTELNPRQREAVRSIHSSGEHLLAMITDILDIAKIEAGKLDLMPAPFDLHDCIDDIGRMLRLRADEKGLTFETLVAGDVPRTVTADQKRLRQVLINLLGNAVKFTDAGRVGLTVSVAAREAGGHRLRFEVEDTGAGIAAERLDTIFRPFEQAGDAAERAGGAGLGLSITHQIVETMGGAITVASVPGQGSRFSVEVVLATPAQVEMAAG